MYYCDYCLSMLVVQFCSLDAICKSLQHLQVMESCSWHGMYIFNLEYSQRSKLQKVRPPNLQDLQTITPSPRPSTPTRVAPRLAARVARGAGLSVHSNLDLNIEVPDTDEPGTCRQNGRGLKRLTAKATRCFAITVFQGAILRVHVSVWECS